MISAKKCVILNMNKAIEKSGYRSIFSNFTIEASFYWSLNILHGSGHLEKIAILPSNPLRLLVNQKKNNILKIVENVPDT